MLVGRTMFLRFRADAPICLGMSVRELPSFVAHDVQFNLVVARELGICLHSTYISILAFPFFTSQQR